MKKKNEIPKPPKKSFNKKMVEETQKRLADWQTLLYNIDVSHFCVEKDLDGYSTDDDGYYADNPEVFESAAFIVTFYALGWHECATCFLCIIFNYDGTFSTDLFENSEDYLGIEDLLSKALMKHGMKTGGWQEGYEMILGIIEEAYENKRIRKPPKS